MNPPSGELLILDVSSSAIGYCVLFPEEGKIEPGRTIQLKGKVLSDRLAQIATLVGRLTVRRGLTGMVIESPIPARSLKSIRACYGAWGAAVGSFVEATGLPVWCVFPSSWQSAVAQRKWVKGEDRKAACHRWCGCDDFDIGEDSKDAYCIAVALLSKPQIAEGV